MQWTATFVTIDRRGKPHAVPVGFTYDDGKFHVQTDRTSVKVRNVHPNPCTPITVYYMRDEAVCVQKQSTLGLRDAMDIPLFDCKARCIVEVKPEKTLFW
jgi:hypothetical protein